MPRHEYTTRRPTRPGWYAVKRLPDHQAEPMLFERDADGTWVVYEGDCADDWDTYVADGATRWTEPLNMPPT